MAKKVIRLTESELVNLVKRTAKDIIKESADNEQWKTEARMFMNGLRNGNAIVDDDTVYVQVFKRDTSEPRYVYFKKGDDRLHDDDFYIQDSPILSRKTMDVIYKRLGWTEDIMESRDDDDYRESPRANIKGEAYIMFDPKTLNILGTSKEEPSPEDNYYVLCKSDDYYASTTNTGDGYHTPKELHVSDIECNDFDVDDWGGPMEFCEDDNSEEVINAFIDKNWREIKKILSDESYTWLY